MARALRIDVPGWYHVTTSCVDGLAAFVAHDDAAIFLLGLAKTVARFGWRCIGYCVMSSHYHFIVETRDVSLSRGLHVVNNAFARDYNERHERRGHVFGERFYSGRIDTDSHLLETCRYVDLNPVRAGICVDPAEWRWSSFRATVGVSPAPAFLDVEAALAPFGGKRDAYVRFVREGIESA
jgi:REP element-mobilizing transposase RayT